LQVASVTRTGLTVTATLRVPPGVPALGIASGPLVIDTTTLAAYHAPGSLFQVWSGAAGFEAWDHQVSVTAATNASPIAMTFDGPHGRATGDSWAQEGILGNPAANGLFTVHVTGPDSLTLDGTTGNGAYTQGGLGWAPIGLSGATIAGSAIELTLARAPGPGAFLAYAEHNDETWNTSGASPMRGGNVRDSTSFVGRAAIGPAALYANWLCNAVMPLT
jgi:hypothetical protein